MYSLKTELMQRDGMTSEEADEFIAELKERIANGEDPEDLLYEECGLEPDFIFDLL